MKYKIPLWQHQEVALKKALDQQCFALFFEMGTGKTAVVVNLMRHYALANNKIPNTLIIAPLVVCPNWAREIAMHAGPKLSEQVLVVNDAATRRCKLEQNAASANPKRIIVINYDALSTTKTWEWLKKLIPQPEFFVVDESHRIKNPGSARARRTRQLARKADYRCILTGSPATQGPLDLWSQFAVLDTAILGDNFYTYRARYYQDANAGWKSKQGYFPKWEPRPGALERINKVIQPYSMRVKKEDCLDLPPVVRVTIPVTMHAPHRRIYDELEKNFFVWVDSEEGSYIKADLALTKTLRLQQLCADCVPVKKTGPRSGSKPVEEKSRPTASHARTNAKLEALKDILADCLEDTANKIIIWSCFASPYQDIAGIVADFGALFVFLTGQQSATEKQESVDAFNNDPAVRVIIANQGAGGEGVNLQAANVLIYFAKSYNLAHDLQSQARADRAGQTRSITRYDLVYRDSVDEIVDRALAEKLNAAEMLLNYREQYGARQAGTGRTERGRGDGTESARSGPALDMGEGGERTKKA